MDFWGYPGVLEGKARDRQEYVGKKKLFFPRSREMEVLWVKNSGGEVDFLEATIPQGVPKIVVYWPDIGCEKQQFPGCAKNCCLLARYRLWEATIPQGVPRIVVSSSSRGRSALKTLHMP